MLDHMVEAREAENPLPLAREYYETKKDQYALIPEKRSSSHILLASPVGRDRKELREKAQEFLSELEAGADWQEYVTEYSDDPGSKQRGGQISRSISMGDPAITPPYSAALFQIDEVGGLRIAESQFGIHIIRLDGIETKSYRGFAEVAAKIMADIEAERETLAIKAIRARFSISDDAYIDGDAMDKAFAPYLQD